MKKTVTINLSGIIFHIDEDAHERLSSYLNKIKGYFKDSEGKDEIMSDIEARIAEMFQEKITKSKEVITTSDVEEVIKIMGKPEDYVDADAGEPASETTTSTDESSYRRKRIFRDPDKNVLGGVCAGIGAYFNFDPIWLRIAFAVAFFFFGSGILLYILLWIIIPEAKTTAEKLEMRGEKVDISNIEKSIKEELEKLKKKFNDLKDEAKNIDTKPHIKKAKNIIEKTVEFTISILEVLLKFIVKFIGIILIAAGIAFIIALLSGLFGANTILSITPTGISTFAFDELLSIFFISRDQIVLGTIALLLVFGIPLIALIYGGIKLLLGIRKKVRGLGMIAVAFWISGCILFTYISVQMINDFAKKGVSKKSILVSQPKGKTLYLDVLDGEFQENDVDEYDSRIVFDDWYCFYNDGERINFGYPKLDVVRSKTDSFEIVLIYTARGESRKKANKRAGNINYQLSTIDSLVQFNPYYSLPDNEKWRDQEVKILVRAPLNASVHLGKGLEKIIYDIDNVTGTYDHDMTGKKWTMLEDGLTCVGCDEDGL
ncbi:MAG: PspC domain-containing protein [Bacteroidota bacterium]